MHRNTKFSFIFLFDLLSAVERESYETGLKIRDEKRPSVRSTCDD